MAERIYSVSQVNGYIKNMFAQDFVLNRIWIRGEVSNCKYHPSGHVYFTLKDRGSVMACVLFAGNRAGLSFRMQEGQTVIVKGTVDVYERDGKYQLYAKEIRLDGIGYLYEQFEARKRELEEMGMFDPLYKKPIPRFCLRVGVVTASTGAALQDIINITKRRNPYVQLYLAPALVQGEGAAASIARALRYLDRCSMDVIIVGRGGGSLEDLWAFNEEEVARAIFECETPVISAVGHETDTTIADYVADLRAPTPSAAAELAVFRYDDFCDELNHCRQVMEHRVAAELRQCRMRLSHQGARLTFYHPQAQLDRKKEQVAAAKETITRLVQTRILENTHKLELAAARLDAASPLKKLGKGYGYVEDSSHRPVLKAAQLSEGDRITVTFADGRVSAQIKNREGLPDGR